jgi:hypothetical protein
MNPKKSEGSSSVSSIATAKDPHGRPLLGDGQETLLNVVENDILVGLRRASVDKVFSYSRFSTPPQDGATTFGSDSLLNKGKAEGEDQVGTDAETVSHDAVTSAAANAMDGIWGIAPFLLLKVLFGLTPQIFFVYLSIHFSILLAIILLPSLYY